MVEAGRAEGWHTRIAFVSKVMIDPTFSPKSED